MFSSSLNSSLPSCRAPQSKKKGSLDIKFIINASKGREQWENLEQNINDWLDEQNIFMVEPQKQQEYYQSQKNFAFEELSREESLNSNNSSNSSISPVNTLNQLSDFSLDITKSNSMLERRSKFTFSFF